MSHFAYSLILLLLAGACGGKKPPPPPPVPSPAPSPPPVSTVPEKAKDPPRIRVLLKERFTSVKIGGSQLGNNLLVQSDGERIRLVERSAGVDRSESGFRLQAVNGALLNVGGIEYRGAVELFVNPLGDPVIVNDLSLEDYLRGVVAAELSPRAFPQMDALKAQAIAARTFAISSLGQHARRGFDVYSDERSQVYRGTPAEHPLSDRAVEDTRGIVATYREKPIVAFYSSTCGGLTADYAVIFQRPAIPYLRGGIPCPDRYSPYHSWNDRISVARIQNRLDQVANIGKLKSLVPLRKSATGRIVEMRFVGTEGEKVLTGLHLRFTLGLKSNWVTRLEARHDESGCLEEVRVKGKGLGHGVGLCQIGAVELAKKNWSFERILKYYYRGIRLEQLW